MRSSLPLLFEIDIYVNIKIIDIIITVFLKVTEHNFQKAHSSLFDENKFGL